MKFNKLIPELSVSDFEQAKKFYVDVLGFIVKYERVENKFIFLELEGNQIMIEENNNNWNTGKLEYPYGRGINISMELDDINKIYNNLKKNNYSLFEDLMISEYRENENILKQKEFLILDPDGYLLRFNQNI